MYKLSKGNLKCHFVIWKPRSCTLAFSMQYMCLYFSNLKIYSYMCQTLYLNSWLQTSYQKYEIHFKILQSKSWGLTYICNTFPGIYIYDCLDLWHIILIIEQLWVKYSIRKQIETVSDSNKGVNLYQFIKFQYWLAIYMYI